MLLAVGIHTSMASGPARQLNSKNIRSALVSRVIPNVTTCSLISAKVSYRKSDGRANANLDELWLQICDKRDECDEAIKRIPGMAFFFSAVAAVESRAKQDQQNEDREEEGSYNNNNNTRPKQVTYWPAISYWIAVQSQNGMRVSTVPIHSVLLETGMEVTAKTLADCKKGKEEQSCQPLCTTLKDHSNSFLQNKVDRSFTHGMEILKEQLMDEPLESSMHGTEHVVRLQVISSSFCSTLRDKGIPALIRAGLRFDVFGIENCSLPSGSEICTKALASPVVVAINDIERAMKKLGYALYRGEIYKKVASSKYTFQHCCNVKKFLSLLGNSEYFKDTIIKYINKLDSILGDPESEFARQLKVNYDLIEVSDGVFFSISKRGFVQHAINDADVGRETPRAFVEYKHDKIPDPRYFQEILENSLCQTDIQSFCEYFVRLLHYGTKQHKEKVLCLIGEPNSGKTSLFAPITRIIPERYIAMITKQKAFNKSLIDHDTQIIFMDEAYAKLLDPDDWKVLTQGGLTAHDRKYKSSTPLAIRCPMFITCQKEMDFGEDHNAAMDARLRTFHFKTLKSPPVAGAMRFMKEHAMDCIVWASSIAVTPVDELPPSVQETLEDNNPFDEMEKDRIRNLNMDDSEDEACQETPAQSRESSEESEGTGVEDDDSSYAKGLEKNLEEIARLRERQPRNSLKRRQLEFIGADVRQFREDCDSRAQLARQRFLEDTKARWIALGMINEVDSDLLESVDGPYHPNIEKSREEYFAKKRADEERQLAEKAGRYYQDEWVLAKERELQELQKQEDAATDPETKRALLYIIEVAVEALKARFQREEVPGLLKYVLLERKKKAVELNWCSPDQAERILSIWCPLPYPNEAQEDERYEIFETPGPSGENASQDIASMPRSQSNDEDDDQDLFITQVATTRSRKSQKRRRTHIAQPGNTRSKKSCTNTILNYFSSQPN